MSLWESLISSWQTLYTNKMRSALTILGIIIGVSAVVFLVSFGRGHQANVTSIFKSMGADALYITSSGRVTTQALQEMTGASGSLTLEDAEALIDTNRAPAIATVAPIIQKTSNVAFGNVTSTITIVGATPEAQRVLNYPIAEGNFISDYDLKVKANVVVLGSQTVSNLFDSVDPIGETIRISGRNFEIIGVLEKKGAFMATMDDLVIVPLTTMQTRILGESSARGQPVQTIAVQVVSTDQIDEATDQITSILRQRHRIREGEDDDFTIINMQEIINRMQQVLAIFQVFLGAVGSISLVVGGIGIMNIMLVSVTERTREIGIRKAVGAKRRDILRQFLIESAMLSFSGGIVGLIIAFIGTQLVTGINLGGYPVKAPMSPDIVIAALSVAIFTGLASGIYPAFRAASLDPIQSLRHE